jgi:signal transduction histidine kinase
LAEAERLGRQTLSEIRQTVGLLGRNGSGEPAAPLPGLSDVPSLVEQFRSAGAPVELSVDGELADLSATSGLAVYRILQEALTNAAKHAPGALVTVRLIVEPDRLGLTVHSAGAAGHGSGLGLSSMRARAELLGGRCAAGPGDTGWTVRAELPLDTSTGPRAVS